MTALADDLLAAHAHHLAGHAAAAEAACRGALRRRPDEPAALHLLGRLAWDAGRVGEALGLFRRAAARAPQVPDFHNSLGAALARSGADPAAALAAFERALALRPDYVEAHRNRGLCLRDSGRLREAQAAFRQALELEPSEAVTWLHLAQVAWRRGDLPGATEGHRRAAELLPDNPAVQSDYLHVLHYDPSASPEQLFAAAVRWGERFDKEVGGGVWRVGGEYPNDPDPNRLLRVGYVSGDLRNHPVGRFLAPILAGHDRLRVTPYCYSHARKPDAYTDRLRSLADAWRDTQALDCDQLADLVRRDGIDVLVDLTGHLANHRLLAFAKRPAPVQVSCIGYPDTTGMRSIQYRITDSVHDPLGETQRWHTEQLVRLPRCCWAYDPGDAPEVTDLPALSTGHVTFACLNRLVKVTPAMIRLWARILARVPGSKLMILIDPGCARDPDIQQTFRSAGVDPARMLACPSRPRLDFLQLFHQVDLCLDTFPYNGHTTTLDAMWMGVPTVSLTGRTHVQRAGLSVLSAVGLAELAPATEDGYVEIAVRVASDLPALADLRRTLRARMAASPLCDGTGLARNLESAYRAMWRAWCGMPA